MQSVWKSQHAEDRLVTAFWDAGHEFHTEMQEAAFNWLDAQLGPAKTP